MKFYKVLEDTRDDINPNVCPMCHAQLRPIVASTTEHYDICFYECDQCKGIYHTLSEYTNMTPAKT